MPPILSIENGLIQQMALPIRPMCLLILTRISREKYKRLFLKLLRASNSLDRSNNAPYAHQHSVDVRHTEITSCL